MTLKKIFKIKILVYILISELSVFFIGGFWWLIIDLLKIQNKPSDIAIKSIAFLIAGIFVYFYCKYDNLQAFKLFRKSIKIKKNDLKLFLVGFAATFSILFTTIVLALATSSFSFQSWGFKVYSVQQIMVSLILVGLVNFLLVAIGEEIIYRGFLLNNLYTCTKNLKLSLVFSALIFSLGHVQYKDILSFIIAFLGGLMLGYAYLRSKSILLPIGIHFGWNFTLFITSFERNNEDVPQLFINNNFKELYLLGPFNMFSELLSVIILFFILKYYFKRILEKLNNQKLDLQL